MKVYRIYIGIGCDENQQPLAKPDIADAQHAIETTLANLFGGYTCFDGNGAWMNAGFIVEEPALVYEVITDKDMARIYILELAENAKKWLKQSAILVTENPLINSWTI